MKNLICFLILIISVFGSVQAQDIEPSENAQNPLQIQLAYEAYLESLASGDLAVAAEIGEQVLAALTTSASAAASFALSLAANS